MSENIIEEKLSSKALQLNTLEVYLPHGKYPSANLEYSWKRYNDSLVTPTHLSHAYDALVDLSIIPTDRQENPFVFVSLGSGLPTQEVFLYDLDKDRHPGNAIFRAVDNGRFDPDIIGTLQRYDANLGSEFFYLHHEGQDIDSLQITDVNIFWIQKSILYFSCKGVVGFDRPEVLLQKYFELLQKNGAVVVDYHDPKNGIQDTRLLTSTGQMILDLQEKLGLLENHIHVIGEGAGRMLVLQPATNVM